MKDWRYFWNIRGGRYEDQGTISEEFRKIFGKTFLYEGRRAGRLWGERVRQIHSPCIYPGHALRDGEGQRRAAGKDAFSRFEPWENPGYYAGVMRFECGGRNFRLERSFDRISKHVSLVCEDDGEELSVEHGDLEMLLGGITPAEFDSTVSVGQLMARPGEELAESLKNYAANYYETGGGEVDLSGALDELRERRKEVERGLKEEERIQDEKRKTLAQERAYLERDLNKLREEYEEKRSAARRAAREKEKRAGQKPQDQRKKGERMPERTREASKHSRGYERNRNISGKGTATGIRIPAGVICLILGTLGILAGLVMNKKSFAVSAAAGVIPVLLLVAGVLLLVSGIQGIRRAKTEQWNDGEEEREDGVEDSILRELERQEERLRWEMSRIHAEWKEKQVRAENLREQEEEITRSDTEKNLLKRRQALLLAEEKIRSAAEDLGQQTSQLLNRRASEIFSELTGENTGGSRRMNGLRSRPGTERGGSGRSASAEGPWSRSTFLCAWRQRNSSRRNPCR